MKLKDVLKPLKEMAPENTAEPWDNVGLQIGDSNLEINRVLLTVDITEEVIEESIKNRCNLIVSHHPLIFKPLKDLSKNSPTVRLAIKAIQNNIAIYTMHTNLDKAENGVNRALGEKLGLEKGKGLVSSGYKEYIKVVVYVPKADADKVREALWLGEAGVIGDYDHCSFEMEGLGRFRPLEGTNPYIGMANQDTEVEELRIETIVPIEKYRALIDRVKQAHPYEEPVIDAYLLQYPKFSSYMGEIVNCKEPLTVEDISKRWGKKLLFYGENKNFKRIAILGGSGSIGLEYAVKNNADLFITGELGYHDLLEALEQGLSVMLLGHGASEALVLEKLQEIIPVEAQIASKPYLPFFNTKLD
jgi:dinuclear metal center YbgI/SA1388 family protein